MRMKDTVPTFSYLVKRVAELYPNLAYIHLTEPRASGNYDKDIVGENESNDYFRELCGKIPVMVAGGYTDTGRIVETISKKGGLIALGRYFISNVRI